MNPVNNNVINDPGAFRRWQLNSPRCKKDYIIKVVATSILAALGVALAVGGAAIAVSTFPYITCIAAIVWTPLVVLTVGVVGTVLVSKLHPFGYNRYDKFPVAKEVCKSIRSTHLEIPTNKDIKNWEFIDELKSWTRYGFINETNSQKLRKYLKRDEKVRAEIKRLEADLTNPGLNQTDIESINRRISDREHLLAIIAGKWRQKMEMNIFRDLPF